MTQLILISAVAHNGVIGRQNTLPWHLPEDLAFFKQTTLGSPILMGRRTWDSIGRALPGRTNIVLTRQPNWRPKSLPDTVPCTSAEDFCAQTDIKTQVVVCQTLDQALAVTAAQYGADRPLFVIGGAEIYRALLPAAHALILTEIDHDFEGDAHFPTWDRSQFREVSRQPYQHTGDPSFSYSFVRYERLVADPKLQEST